MQCNKTYLYLTTARGTPPTAVPDGTGSLSVVIARLDRAIQYHCGAYFDGRWLLDAPVKPAHDDGEVYQFEREPL